MQRSTPFCLLLLLLLVCSLLPAGAADDEKAAKPEQGTWQEKRFVAPLAADGVQRVEMVGSDFYFEPNVIVVKVLIPVELQVRKAAGFIPHNLIAKAPEAGIDFAIELKEEAQTIKFTPTLVGRYPIYCGKRFLWFKSHRERGMEGAIEVVE